MRCIIVDDEPLVRELVQDNLSQVPFLELVTSCKSALDALEVLQKQNVDLIFLHHFDACIQECLARRLWIHFDLSYVSDTTPVVFELPDL